VTHNALKKVTQGGSQKTETLESSPLIWHHAPEGHDAILSGMYPRRSPDENYANCIPCLLNTFRQEGMPVPGDRFMQKKSICLVPGYGVYGYLLSWCFLEKKISCR
jgi:hypothetical protein